MKHSMVQDYQLHEGHMWHYMHNVAKNYNIEGDISNHSSHVTSITRMDVANELVKIMFLLIGH